MNTDRQVKQAVCAALNCRRRKDLIPVKTLALGLLLDVDLCPEHEAEHQAGLHAAFRETTGMDFVDPVRQ